MCLNDLHFCVVWAGPLSGDYAALACRLGKRRMPRTMWPPHYCGNIRFSHTCLGDHIVFLSAASTLHAASSPS